MSELLWLIMAMWAFLLTLFFVVKNPALGGISGFMGLLFSLMLASESLLATLILFILNFYIIYYSIFDTKGKR